MDHQAADPFDALGLEARFDLDAGEVERAYLARVASVHPDRVRGGEAGETARTAAALNDARRTLRDPEQRAVALLARLGGPSAAEDRSLPEGFLMEMMEVRERAERECLTPEGHGRWERWAEERRGEHLARVAALFSGPASAGDAAACRAVRRELNAWRYVERMIEQLDPTRGGGIADR